MPPDDPARSRDSLGELIATAYPSLRGMAAARARGCGISPSSLTQDAVCRLLRLPQPPSSAEQVQAVAWRLMEWIVLDRVRAQGARVRREQGRTNHDSPPTSDDPRLARLADALGRLAEQSPRKAEAMTLSALCGLSMERIAELLDVTPRTVRRDLEFAKAWLASVLGGNGDAGSRAAETGG